MKVKQIKSEKGVTLLELTIYIIVLFIVLGTLTIISNFFNDNMDVVRYSAKYAGEFDKYDEFVEQYSKIVPYLLKAKEQYEDRCAKMAVEHKDTDYHMVIGSGMLWGEAYDYAMCILEEMQWIKTKSIH